MTSLTGIKPIEQKDLFDYLSVYILSETPLFESSSTGTDHKACFL
jgi:hypothetical protein